MAGVALKRTMSCSSCALLTALLLLAAPVDLSSHHGCMDGAAKAHQELQFVQRAEFREPPRVEAARRPAPPGIVVAVAAVVAAV
jgi:hypothetical protein